MKFLLTFIVSVVSAIINGSKAGFTVEPRDTVALSGVSATFSCSVDRSTIHWHRRYGNDVQTLAIDCVVQSAYQSQYRVLSTSTTECNLVVINPTIGDSSVTPNDFQCQENDQLQQRTAKLIVLESALTGSYSPPMLTRGSTVQISSWVRFTGSPGPTLQWTPAGQTIIESTQTPNFTNSTIEVRVPSDAKVFSSPTCQVSFPASVAYTPYSWKVDSVEVQYGPENVSIQPPAAEITPCTILTCSSDAYPAPGYYWTNETSSDTDRVSSTSELAVTEGNFTVRCTAYNNVTLADGRIQTRTAEKSVSLSVTGTCTLTTPGGVSAGGGFLWWWILLIVLGIILLILLIIILLCVCCWRCPLHDCCRGIFCYCCERRRKVTETTKKQAVASQATVVKSTTPIAPITRFDGQSVTSTPRASPTFQQTQTTVTATSGGTLPAYQGQIYHRGQSYQGQTFTDISPSPAEPAPPDVIYHTAQSHPQYYTYQSGNGAQENPLQVDRALHRSLDRNYHYMDQRRAQYYYTHQLQTNVAQENPAYTDRVIHSSSLDRNYTYATPRARGPIVLHPGDGYRHYSNEDDDTGSSSSPSEIVV